MTSIKALVNGCNGKVGKVLVPAILKTTGIELVATLDKEDNLKQVLKNKQVDVAIDFTHPAVVMENTICMIDHNVHPVIGTTGLSSTQLEELKLKCENKKLGCIVAPNFSIGAVLMMKFALETGKYLKNVEIIELHHDRKVDSPSGTSLKTAEMIASTLNMGNTKDKTEQEVIPGCRGGVKHGIHIHSIRLPGLMAHQQVVFASPGEVLTIKHDVMNREAFIPGIMLAVRKVVDLDKLVYGLEHFL